MGGSDETVVLKVSLDTTDVMIQDSKDKNRMTWLVNVDCVNCKRGLTMRNKPEFLQ